MTAARPANRGTALTVFAVLFGMLAISNLLKPLQLGGDRTGFVLFGKRLSGTPNLVVGPLFALFLALYAASIWTMRRRALWMARLYVAYVFLNLVLFNVRSPHPSGAGWFAFSAVYAAVALGVAGGAAWLLAARRDELR